MASHVAEFAAQPADLTLGGAAHDQRPHRLVHGVSGDALHAGRLDHGGEPPLRDSPRRQKLGESLPLPLRGLGIISATVPARVPQVRSRQRRSPTISISLRAFNRTNWRSTSMSALFSARSARVMHDSALHSSRCRGAARALSGALALQASRPGAINPAMSPQPQDAPPSAAPADPAPASRLRRRLIWLAGALALGTAAAWVVHAVSHSEAALLPVPAALAMAWLRVGTPQDCTPASRQEARRTP